MSINKLYKRYYSNSSSTYRYKILGKTRHHIFTNKEWKDSAYNYNKTGLKELYPKYKLTNKLIRHHFNIDDLRDIARSRRMRSLIIRSSSKRIFLAKPEIKQTTDKVSITVYTFDRQRQALIRNLYFYNRNSYINNTWLTNRNQRIFSLSNNLKLYAKKHTKLLKRRFPYNNLKFKNEMDFLRLRFSDLLKKFLNMNNNFMFLFLSSLLSYFNIKIFNPFIQNNKINRKRNSEQIEYITNKKPEILIIVNNKHNALNIIKKDNINSKLLNFITSIQNTNINETSINKEKLNNFLLYFLYEKLDYANIINKEQITLLNIRLKNDYYNRIITNYFKNKNKVLGNFAKLELNKLKYSSFLINLKKFIGNVYDKNAELNIVNLKYMYLNSDIYSELIANKLRKKSNVARILRRSLRLVRLPYDFILRTRKNNFNDFQELDRHRSSSLTNPYYNLNKLSINNNTDSLSLIFEKLFPNQQIHNDNNQFELEINKNKLIKRSKVINVLNTIRYKWIKGVKLEIAGRLTRRNTASRSMFKFRSKGNLNNKQYYWESNLLYSLSPIMLRNSVKGNSQHTQVTSKRRIGAFGIKSWISSY